MQKLSFEEAITEVALFRHSIYWGIIFQTSEQIFSFFSSKHDSPFSWKSLMYNVIKVSRFSLVKILLHFFCWVEHTPKCCLGMTNTKSFRSEWKWFLKYQDSLLCLCFSFTFSNSRKKIYELCRCLKMWKLWKIFLFSVFLTRIFTFAVNV